MDFDNIDTLLEQASRLLEAGRAEAALKFLAEVGDRVLDADLRIEWACLQGEALAKLGRHAEAIELLDALLEEFPQAPRLLATLGTVLSANEELDEARDALEEAVAVSPEDDVAVANLAWVYEKMGDCPRALELYERALGLGADIDWVLQRRAAVLAECGRYAEAKATLKRYLSLVPDDAEQWIALGILHSDDAEYAAAFACYQEAERLMPDAVSLRLNWGVTAVRARELKTAYRQLARLRKLEPRSTRWWLLRAFILEEEGDIAGARAIYDRVVRRERFAENAELAYALEMAMDFYARQKLLPQCRQLLRRAYALNACTVELCEAYREAAGEHADKAYWFSIVLEADYRDGLNEVREAHAPAAQRPTRFVRNFQVVARNHDEAIGLVLDMTRRMGEAHAAVREFAGSEPMDDAYCGLYEVEPDCFVFGPDRAR